MDAITQKHKSKALAPKLRFNEFQDNWTKTKLGQVATFKKGKGISKTDLDLNGNFECIRYGELYTTYNELINEVRSKTNIDKKELIFSEANDVIIPSSGETQIEIATASCVLKSGIALGGDINIIRTSNNGVFLSFYLNNKKKRDIAKLAQGSSVVHLYSSQLESLVLNLPSLPEQEKIAAFLGAVDEKIQQLTRKKQLLEQYKKGVMQQLFSGKLRFKDENGKAYPKWEEKKLGDLLDYIQPTKYLVESTEYDDSYKTPVLTAGKTFILGYTNETKNIFCENLPVIIFDDFTTATQFVDFPFKAKSSAMKILVAKKNENIRFIYESMQLIKFEVGGHGRHWISQFALMNINYPCLEEQKKIANFLSAIDAKINKGAEELEATNQFKKGLLQQMFV